jgi:hypothetical protein
MTSIYGIFAKDCARVAAKTKSKSNKTDLLRLAEQWKVVQAEQKGEIGKSAVRATQSVHAPPTCDRRRGEAYDDDRR